MRLTRFFQNALVRIEKTGTPSPAFAFDKITYKITITNGRITEATTKLVPTPTGQAHILEIAIVFETIEVEWTTDGASASDSWSAGPG